MVSVELPVGNDTLEIVMSMSRVGAGGSSGGTIVLSVGAERSWNLMRRLLAITASRLVCPSNSVASVGTFCISSLRSSWSCACVISHSLSTLGVASFPTLRGGGLTRFSGGSDDQSGGGCQGAGDGINFCFFLNRSCIAWVFSLYSFFTFQWRVLNLFQLKKQNN